MGLCESTQHNIYMAYMTNLPVILPTFTDMAAHYIALQKGTFKMGTDRFDIEPDKNETHPNKYKMTKRINPPEAFGLYMCNYNT